MTIEYVSISFVLWPFRACVCVCRTKKQKCEIVQSELVNKCVSQRAVIVNNEEHIEQKLRERELTQNQRAQLIETRKIYVN